MTSHSVRLTTTDVKPELEFHKMNEIYAALSIHAQTEKTTFSCKDACILTKYTQRWTYTARDFEIPLCHLPPLRSFFDKMKIYSEHLLCHLASCLLAY